MKHLFSAFAILTVLTVYSCATPSHTTQLVRDIQRDTVYLSNTQFDSIYIFKDRLTDRTRDTVYLKDISIEYRYKMLRDTIKVVQRDSIPYEVTIVETKEISRPLTVFDKLCRLCFWVLIGASVTFLFTKIKRVF